MTIEYGSIEYFELLSLEQYLNGYRLDLLDLENLDRLRAEVERKIKAANMLHNERNKKD